MIVLTAMVVENSVNGKPPPTTHTHEMQEHGSDEVTLSISGANPLAAK